MLITEFVEKYNRLKKQDEKLKTDKALELVKSHIKNVYMSYEDKIIQARNVIDRSCYKIINDKSVFILNTPVRYMMFILSIIEFYTDLEWDKTILDGEEANDVLSGFNLLEKNGLTELILNTIGSDIERYKTILDMTMDDVLDENRSFVPFLESKFESFGMILDTLEGILSDSGIRDNIVKFTNKQAD